jgi:4-hydroxybenzoate polyprenyltransferase
MIPAVHICPECNTVVDRPVGGKCAQGHSLYERRIFAQTTTITFGAAWWHGFLSAMAAAFALYLLRSWLGNTSAIFLVVLLPLLAVIAILRGLKWRRQGDPSSRLAPRAFGIAAGWLSFLALSGLAALIFR